MKEQFSPDLERRLAELEKPENQGSDLAPSDWLFLLLSGIVFPGLLLIWGW